MIGLRSSPRLNGRGGGRVRRMDSVAQKPPPITFVMTETPNREVDGSDPEEALNKQTRAEIRTQNTYLETYLNFQYNFGIIPLRLLKNGEIVTSTVNESLEENWSVVISYSFGLVKDIAAIFIATTIATEVRKYFIFFRNHDLV